MTTQFSLSEATALGAGVDLPGRGSGHETYKRYTIDVKAAPDLTPLPSRFHVKVKKHRLALMLLQELFRYRGNLKVVLSRPCVYGVFSGPVGGFAPREHLCVGCLRCTTEYPEVVQIYHNPARRQLGDSYFSPEYIESIAYESQTGRIPVRGAGYRGKFGGEGWDGMWTDMSEIVRPTRDGIHGREFISTVVDIGEKPPMLQFDDTGLPIGAVPKVISIPIPFLFDVPAPSVWTKPLLTILVEAAKETGTFAFVPVSLIEKHGIAASSAVPIVRREERSSLSRINYQPRMIEISGWDEQEFLQLSSDYPGSMICARLPFTRGLPEKLLSAFSSGLRVFHIVADYHGRSDDGRFILDLIREAHGIFVAEGVRDEVTLIGSGGIIAAEHVPKAIICGLDAVALDTPVLMALQAKMDGECKDPQTSRFELPHLNISWGVQRLKNLLASWHDQLLEVLGAMGLREVRRLRGEIGRAMFQKDLEREAFEGIPGLETRPLHPDVIPTAEDQLESNEIPPPIELRVGMTTSKSADPDRSNKSIEHVITRKHTEALRRGFHIWPELKYGNMAALGDYRWTADLILSTWKQAETGKPPHDELEYRVGDSGGGFDLLDFRFLPPGGWTPSEVPIDTSISLSCRPEGRRIEIPVPWYGGGMSYGSVSEHVMLARAKAAQRWGTFTSTGEGGYPDSLVRYKDHVITQIATGMFGVREETIQHAPIVEFKYAQGAKPGLGGHLLGDKTTIAVAKMRESVPWVSLFSPFPFHSVYSVEDHKKHVDWIKTVNPEALVCVKVSTPTDIDMVAVGSYYAGAHILQIDGGYGGTGAAPEIAKKNIAMPIEFAIPKVHRYLLQEGIRDEIVIMASGGIRTAYDIAKAIALGADGVVLGTAELVAMGCTRCSNCERGRGCPFGLTTTDPELSQLVDPDWGAERLSNLYESFKLQLSHVLRRLGLKSIRELRGRTDLLVYKRNEMQ